MVWHIALVLTFHVVTYEVKSTNMFWFQNTTASTEAMEMMMLPKTTNYVLTENDYYEQDLAQVKKDNSSPWHHVKVMNFSILQSQQPDRPTQYFLTDNVYYEGGNNGIIVVIPRGTLPPIGGTVRVGAPIGDPRALHALRHFHFSWLEGCQNNQKELYKHWLKYCCMTKSEFRYSSHFLKSNYQPSTIP